MEIAALLAFLGIVIIGALLGLLAFWKVRKVEALPEQVAKLRAEISALRQQIDAAAPNRVDTQAPDTPYEDLISDRPEAGPVESPQPDDSRAADTVPSAKPSLWPDRGQVAARTSADPSIVGPSNAEELKTSGSPSPTATTDQSSPKRMAPPKDIESTVGALWAVWVGGIALAFGGIFLVRYSMEQGWLGPVARVSFGLAFGIILGAIGEWTRRRDKAFSFAGFEKANIPAILTASGTVAAFASIYAAYELYDLISPAVAFVLLGAVAIAGLTAALLHGILLAAVGLLGSYCVPLLVSTNEPKPLALALYILIVSAAAFGVARVRLWRWLAIVASGGLILWGLVLLAITGTTDRPIMFGYAFASLAMAYLVFIVSLYDRVPAKFLNVDRVATSVLTGNLLLLLGAILFQTYDALTILVLAAIVLGCFGAAYFYAAVRYVLLAGMVVITLGYLGWSVPLDDVMLFTDNVGSSFGPSTPMLENIRQNNDTAFVWTGIILAGLAAGLGFYGTLKSASRALLAIGGTALPILLLSVAYVRMEMFQSSLLFGGLALVLGLAIGALANRFYFQLPEDVSAREEAISAYAIASIAAIALAIGFTLEKGALTIALALVVPATAFVYARRPLASLRPVAIIVALLWVARIAWDPRIVGAELGTLPIFNWLLYGYGIPTAGFAVSAWLLGLDQRDRWLEILEAITIASLAVTIGLLGLHAIDPAEVFTRFDTLAEAAIVALVSGGIALGLLRITRTQSSKSMAMAVTGLGYAGMAIGGIGLLVFWNPLFTGEKIGSGLIFNQLTFGYLLTAGLYALLAYVSRGKRPVLYSGTSAALSFALFATWVTLTIRHAFHPTNLLFGSTTDTELYVYSIVWLGIGVAVLIAGILTGHRPVRLLSGAILIAVIAKVFLIDMANLTGVLRALSFIGLGIVLIGIGLMYQRLLRKPADNDPGVDQDNADTIDEASIASEQP